jgi:hypothetical protein
MPSAEEFVDFLREQDAIVEGQSPWPSWNEEEERSPIAWNRLFPSGRPRGDVADVENRILGKEETRWRPSFPEELGRTISEVVGRRPSQPRRTAEGTESGGWDVCAWYQPMHYFGNRWGIYIRQDCIVQRMKDIARFLPPGTRVDQPLLRELCRAGFASFFLHEQFHHMVESLGIRMHVVQRRTAYTKYFSLVYAVYRKTDDNLEDALATANSYHRLASPPYSVWIGRPVLDASWEFYDWSVPGDPPGYRQATKYFGYSSFEAGEDVLQARIDDASLKPSRSPSDWRFATRMMTSLFKVTDHLWEIVPPGGKPLAPTP